MTTPNSTQPPKPDNSPPADVAALSFEQAMNQLEEIVRQLEGQGGGLDEAIGLYERGAALKRHCENKLREAQARIEKVVIEPDGTVSVEPLDVE